MPIIDVGGKGGGAFGFGGGLSGSTFSDFGGAVSDLFGASAAKSKAAGLRTEAEQYTLAAGFADQNAQFTKQSTAIKEFQQGRDIMKTIGQQQAAVADSGFAASGSALDLERDSANQGAIAQGVLAQQGLIEEAGYEEQAASYRLMADAANQAANSADKAATGDTIAAVIKGAAGIATLF
jgi:hypothetical protein